MVQKMLKYGFNQVFLMCLLFFVVNNIGCTKRGWDNPVDPDYNSTWTKFFDSPEVLGIMDYEHYLFSINKRLYFINSGSSIVLYELLDKKRGWMKVGQNFFGSSGKDAILFQNKIFILLGYAGKIDFSVIYFDPATNTFGPEVHLEKTAGPLTAISGSSNKLYVLGSDTSGNGQTLLYDLEPFTGKLTLLTSTSYIKQKFTSAVVNNELFIIGGTRYFADKIRSENTDEVVSFNFITNTWKSRAKFSEKSDKLTSVVFNESIYVFNGKTCNIYRFQPAQDTWEREIGYGLFVKELKPSMTVHNNILLIWNGVIRTTTKYEVYAYNLLND